MSEPINQLIRRVACTYLGVLESSNAYLEQGQIMDDLESQ